MRERERERRGRSNQVTFPDSLISRTSGIGPIIWPHGLVAGYRNLQNCRFRRFLIREFAASSGLMTCPIQVLAK